MNTPNNGLPLVPENTIDPAAGLNSALMAWDMITQLGVVSIGANAPPAGVEGQRHIVGTAPTGAWAGQANRVARFLNAAWSFSSAHYAVLISAQPALYFRGAAGWASAASLVNPMTVAGDLIRGGALGAPERVAPGANGQVLTLVSGVPAWAAPSVPAVATESGTARTLGLADANAYLRFTSASASTATIPPQSGTTWAANTEIHIRRAAAGNLTLTPGSGVTLNAPSGGTLVMTERMSVTLKRVAENVWDVVGQTVPA